MEIKMIWSLVHYSMGKRCVNGVRKTAGSDREIICQGPFYGYNSVRACGRTEQVGPGRVPLCAIHQTMALYLSVLHTHTHTHIFNQLNGS